MFTYTDAQGRTQTVDIDVTAVLDARRNDGIVWYPNNDTRAGRGESMRDRFGVTCNASRLGFIRASAEWRTAVIAYAEANTLDAESLIADCCPRQNRRRRRRTAAPTAVTPVPGSRTARQQARRQPTRQQAQAEATPPPTTQFSAGYPSQFPTRQFGVELEVLSTKERAPMKHLINGIHGVSAYVGHYDRVISGAWKMGTDISIKIDRTDRNAGYRETMEIVSPPLSGQNGLEQLERVLETIAPYTAVNRSCGLHCHIDLDGISVAELRKISAAWLTKEWAVNTLIPEHRRYQNNNYCHDNGYPQQLAEFNWNRAQQSAIGRVAHLRKISAITNEMAGETRRRKLNLKSKHNTVEFRYGAGSVDVKEVINYVKFCLGFVEHHKQAECVKPDTAKPTLWQATSTMLNDISIAVADPMLPYFFTAKQARLATA